MTECWACRQRENPMLGATESERRLQNTIESQAAEIERLRESVKTARNDALEDAAAECERQRTIFGSEEFSGRQPWGSVVERAASTICATAIRRLKSKSGPLRGTREKLEAALKPFADAADDAIDVTDEDGWDVWEHSAAMSVTIGDFRRAKAALGKDKP